MEFTKDVFSGEREMEKNVGRSRLRDDGTRMDGMTTLDVAGLHG